MESYLPFLPLFAVVAGPAVLPDVVHSSFTHFSRWTSAPFLSTTSPSIAISTTNETFAEIGLDGSVKVNWDRLQTYLSKCAKDDYSWSCAFARAMTATRDGTWEPLP